MFATLTTMAAVPALADATEPPVAEMTMHRQSGVVSLTLGNNILVHVRTMPSVDKSGEPRATLVLNVLLPSDPEQADSAQRALAQAAATGWTGMPEGPKLRAALAPEGLAIRWSGKQAHLAEALQQATTMLALPTVDEARLTQWKTMALGRAQRRESATENAVGDAMLQVMARGRGLAQPPKPLTAPDIEAVNADRAQERLSKWLCGPGLPCAPIEAAICGEVNLGQVCDTVGRTLGQLSSRQPVTAMVCTTPNPFGEQTAVETGGATEGNKAADHRALLPSMECQERTVVSTDGHGYAVCSLPGPQIGSLSAVRYATAAARVVEERLNAALMSAGLDPDVVNVACMPGRQLDRPGMVLATVRLRGDRVITTRAGELLRKTLRSAAGETSANDTQPAKPITDAEAQRAGSVLARESRARLEDPDYWSSVLSFCRAHGLSPEELADAPRVYESLTGAELSESVRSWLRQPGAVQLLVLPQEEP